MRRLDTVYVLAGLLIAVGVTAIGFGAFNLISDTDTNNRRKTSTPLLKKKLSVRWAATAPGRVEPRKGEIRIGSSLPGRITKIFGKASDKVSAGDVLIVLEDEIARARVREARAFVKARKKTLDADTSVKPGVKNRRRAQTELARAVRELASTRARLDLEIERKIDGEGSSSDVSNARRDVSDAKKRVTRERKNVKHHEQNTDLTKPTQFEIALISARAKLSQAIAAHERTRIRASVDGTILRVAAKIGEVAAPSPEVVLMVIGDMTGLRVRAELDERDLGKLRVGQRAYVRADAFEKPGFSTRKQSTDDRRQDFEAKITSIAPALAPRSLAIRGRRNPADVDVLEVLLEVRGKSKLLPGMRVDVFFNKDTTAQR